MKLPGIPTLVLATFMSGLLGFLSASTQTWRDVEATGGIEVMQPVVRDRRLMLPVNYDVSGLRWITCKPTAMNSGQGVWEVRARVRGQAIWVTVLVCLHAPEFPAGGVHYAKLSGVGPGKYTVYYGEPGDRSHPIGSVVIAEQRG